MFWRNCYSLTSLISITLASATVKHAPIVETKSGPVRGILEESEDGLIYKYMGIPYQSVDPRNSFGRTLPVTTWNNTQEANSDATVCPQREEFNKKLIGDIDCLRLNVYTPLINRTGDKLPLMVWTYGGGFTFGYGSQYTHGPEKLVRHGIVLITYNYRLGPYGLMCLGDDQVPGNAAFMDMVNAFKWVNENIEMFGGDPDDITAFGQSAGSKSTEFLMLSPISKHLFHKVILQSGSGLISNYSKDYATNREKVLQLANTLGCGPAGDMQASGSGRSGNSDMISYLSTLAPSKVIQATEDLGMSFSPCLENDSSGRESFWTKQPVELYLEKGFKPKPMMIGLTSKEGMSEAYKAKNLLDSNSPLLESNIKKSLDGYRFSKDNEKNIVSKIVQQFYFGNDGFDFDGWVDFESDTWKNFLSDKSVDLHLKKSKEAIFYYVFGYDGSRNYAKTKDNYTVAGAAHADELAYLFLQPWNLGLTNNDQLIMDRMTAMWTNFAKYNNPIPELNELLEVKWDPVNHNEKNYLYIDSEMYMAKRPFHSRIAFWDLIFKNHFGVNFD